MFQIHPFSVITTPETSKDCGIIVEVVGTWTRAVQQSLLEGRGVIRSAWIDGAYGNLNIPFFKDVPLAVFVAGGIGIAPVLSLMKYYHHKGLKNNGRIKLIWTCRSTELFSEFADEMGSFINRDNSNISLQLFHTGDDPFEIPLEDVVSNSSAFYQCIINGKPNLPLIFTNIATEIEQENSGIKRVGVFACGSKRLRNSVLSSCISTRNCHFTVHSESFTL